MNPAPTRTCDACDQPFTPEEWDDRHTEHEEDCPGEDCDCDLVYHAECCPLCKGDTAHE